MSFCFKWIKLYYTSYSYSFTIISFQNKLLIETVLSNDERLYFLPLISVKKITINSFCLKRVMLAQYTITMRDIEG